MSPRFLGLGVGAAVILGGLIYLFVLVRAEPAASVSSTDPTMRSRTTPAATAGTPSPTPTPPTADDTAARGDQPPARTEIGRDIADQIASRAPSATVGGGGSTDEAAADPDKGAQMDEANKLYDQGDYDAAQKQALRILEQMPDSVRMRRIVVSTACMGGDNELAGKHYALLPARDQNDMTRRCERYGVSLKPTTAPAPPK